jgi:hypothetical protein
MARMATNKSDRDLQELKNNLKHLEEPGQREVLNYARLLQKSREENYEPPTAEQFSRCPGWLKWKFALMLLPYVIQAWLAELGLRIGGAPLPHR